MNKPKLTYLTPKTHEEWLQLRKGSIGGSDAAAIVGQNRYCSPYQLWVDKTCSTMSEEKENEALRQGTELEGYVAWRFMQETGKKVRKRSKTIKNTQYPFAHANVDRWIVGENAGLECKTTSSLNLAQFKNGSYPPNYYLQCLHYMAVTGADKYYLAVLIFGKEFKVFEIERDEELIDYLMTAEKNFWECVENNIAPPVDGSVSTGEALLARYSDPNDDEIDLTICSDPLLTLLDLKAKRKELDSEIERYEQEVKSVLGNAQSGYYNDVHVTWREQTRTRFDSKSFIRDHPELDLDKYYTTKQTRVFRVNQLDESN